MIYPMALMFLAPLSPLLEAWFPHVIESSIFPPVPNPILELQELQLLPLFPTIPILALERLFQSHSVLNPSLLHLISKEALEPISDSRVTTQWSIAVLPISDQWIQGTGGPVDYNKLDLLTDLHTEADLGEGCVPVGGKFGLLCVKPSLPSVKVNGFFLVPKTGVVVKRSLSMQSQ